ncbi:hypothetical protein J5I95_03795 [Candidatus Poribacteria bacterium]|nr:hypothetical protein [Candidatus Poribacteria bacterium]
MHKRIAIGLIVLIFVLGVVSVFVMLQPDPDPETETVSTDIDPAEIEHAVPSKPARPARDGYKWENHGDHWHEVLLAQEDAQIVDERGSESEEKPIHTSISLAGEVDIMDLPDMSADIDPADIPPFTVTLDGAIYHYNRPLTSEERSRYDFIKSLPGYESVSPARLKMDAIAYVRHEQIKAGVFEQISSDLIVEFVEGRITREEFRHQKEVFRDEFFERTR